MRAIKAMGAAALDWGASRIDAALLCFGSVLFVVQGIVITAFATNLPFSDGWMFLRPGGLEHALSWSWVWAQHNEHRLVWTKLLHWLNFRYLGYSLSAQASVNYILYACLVWTLLDFVKRHFQTPRGLLLICLSSALIWEVHFWGFQTHFLLYPLCLMWALRTLMHPGRTSWLGVAWAAAGAYSMAPGVIAAGCCALFCAARACLQPALRRRLVGQAALIAASVLPWCVHYHRPAGHVAFAGPTTRLFWWHLALTTTRGFGVWDAALAPMGVLVFVAFAGLWAQRARLVLHAAAHMRDAATEQRVAWLALATYSLSMVLTMGVTSMARANFDSPAPRHLYPVVMLMPMLWALLCRDWLHKRWHFILAGAAILTPLAPYMRYPRIYAAANGLINASRGCVQAYYRSDGDGVCDESYPGKHLPALLQRAREMRLPFTQDMLPALEHGTSLPSFMLAQKLCGIDNFDGVQLSDTSAKTTLVHHRDAPLQITGWGWNPNLSYPQMDTFVALEAQDGQVFSLRAERIRRRGLHFAPDAARRPWGVQLHTKLTDVVPDGHYTVYIQQGYGERAAVCESRVHIKIMQRQ